MGSFDIKQAALMAAIAASAAWLGPRSTPPDRAPSASRPVTVPIREPSRQHRDQPIAIESLHDWQPRPATPQPRSRNLFAFAAAPRSTRALPDQARVEAPAPAPVASPSAPPAPLLKLIGLAEDADATGASRTAIISGNGQLFVVTSGDAVTSRYRVTSVSPTLVDLMDLLTGETLRLALK
jgi:hypothetical protein